LCIPTYVLDLPGGYGKTPLGPNYVEQREGFEWEFRNYEDVTRHYTEVVDENPPAPSASAAADK
jgi:lysine 2,3-aminomutase